MRGPKGRVFQFDIRNLYVFAIGNILLITVKERTKEIGVRRALGATPFEIKRQIVIEAIFLAKLFLAKKIFLAKKSYGIYL